MPIQTQNAAAKVSSLLFFCGIQIVNQNQTLPKFEDVQAAARRLDGHAVCDTNTVALLTARHAVGHAPS